MRKPVVTRNLMLDFISEIRPSEDILPERIFKLNDKSIQNGNIIYSMTREFRVKDNWALLFANNLAKEYNKKLSVILYLDKKIYSERQMKFMQEGIKFVCKNLDKNNISHKLASGNLIEDLKSAGTVVVDFNPINLQNELAQSLNCTVYEIDSHNIIPARFISDKKEFSAATLRRKVYGHISNFLTEFPDKFIQDKGKADIELEDFIKNKLEFYTEQKNNPNKNATSGLSKYLHSGQISSQRIALEVLKSNASRANKEAFLEELIVRKELADNFCLYGKSYTTLDGIDDWAKKALKEHSTDFRQYIYSLEEFENSTTHEPFWNKIQSILVKEGKIHGYLRMYWAKKILEWSKSPEEALKIAIYLNDTYALDGNDPNGYVGILWSIGGLHDRAFSSRPAMGKIRYMSLNGCKKKFDIDRWING